MKTPVMLTIDVSGNLKIEIERQTKEKRVVDLESNLPAGLSLHLAGTTIGLIATQGAVGADRHITIVEDGIGTEKRGIIEKGIDTSHLA